MKSVIGWSVLLVVSLLISACSLFGSKTASTVLRIVDLQPAVRFDFEASTRQVTPEEVLEKYQLLLDSAIDDELRVKIEYRIADLNMLVSEKRQVDDVGGTQEGDEEIQTPSSAPIAISASSQASYFESVTENYQALLARFPNREGNDALLYQLAKAYDLDAKQDLSMQTLTHLVDKHPQSVYYIEAQFRRAEVLFSGRDYKTALKSYQQVIEKGRDSQYFNNALYMSGWSLFKLNRYESALLRFAEVLDVLLVTDQTKDLAGIVTSADSIVVDTLRIMSQVFSYLDGVDAIEDLFAQIGAREYEYLIYDGLGQLLLRQERYADTARTYSAFVEKYPASSWSPHYHVALMDAYKTGGFAGKLFAEKERFVQFYGVYSDFWRNASPALLAFLRPHLYVLLEEMAQYYHADALARKSRLTKAAGRNKKREVAMVAAFEKVVPWYQAFIDTFPDDGKVAEKKFLLAESLYDARNYEQAILAFDAVAYDDVTHPRDADAGYHGILSRQWVCKSRIESEVVLCERQLIESQLRFAKVYSADARVEALLISAAQALLAVSEYLPAIDAAMALLQREPGFGKETQLTAWLVIAHSRFALLDYSAAEVAYGSALALMAPQDKTRKDILELLAACVYKQGEALVAMGDLLGAVDQYLRVDKVAPGATIIATSLYDAAAMLLQLKDWRYAIVVLEDFRQRFPLHPLNAEIPAKLALAYSETQQWALAAAQYGFIADLDEDPEIRRESLYLSAGLYQKAGVSLQARNAYRRYAHEYPEPLDLLMEAQFSLSEYYQKTGEDSKRRYWLKKMIVSDAGAGAARNDRSRSLAAMSQAVFAKDAQSAFNRIKLRIPLKQSMKTKKRALDKALAEYQKLADYGFAEYATQASYAIGAIYMQLSHDLIKSDRPAGLSELELEQYEILLEEQAFPFEEDAIAVHAANAERSWTGLYDEWVKRSFLALREMLPARYDKEERRASHSDGIY